MEYKRPDVGLKIYREALANLRLGVDTPYAHENSNQSLILSESDKSVFNKINTLRVCFIMK